MYFLNNCKDLWPEKFNKEQESLVIFEKTRGNWKDLNYSLFCKCSKLPIFLRSQQPHRPCYENPTEVTQYGSMISKVGLCHKFPFLPSPDCDLVTFKYINEITSPLCLYTPLWFQIKVPAHRYSLCFSPTTLSPLTQSSSWVASWMVCK